MKEAQLRQEELRANWFPQLYFSASAGQSNNFAAILAPRTASSLDDKNLASLLGQTQNYFVTSRFSVSQLVLDWGANSALETGELAEGLAREQLRVAQHEVVLQVKAAYLSLVAASATVDVKIALVRLVQARLEAARKREERGVAAPLEVLQAEGKLLAAEWELQRNRREKRKAESALALALGRAPVGSSNLQVRPRSTANGSSFKSEPTRTLPPLSEAIAAAQARRPDLQILEVLLRQEHLRKELAGRSQWPNLALALSAGLLGSTGLVTGAQYSLLGPFQPDLGITTTVSWNLFDGLRTQKRVEQAELAVLRQLDAKLQLSRTIAAEVEDERAIVNEALESRKLALKEHDLAQRAWRLAKSRLDKGIAMPLDLLEAEVSVLQAQEGALKAEIEYKQAEARLAKAMGEDYLSSGSP
ncbi:MAG: TolC family protein [Cyanobacteria bacterium NC_groundwater_1444_Ag_S-0.65um_54_12]|nr:TolC family protein [Cyanobacteria bacterium NC_groundwater_1444_Ag_S-0.65um_54_12]